MCVCVCSSQAMHHMMRTCEDPELTALIKDRTRVRTMGHPPPQIEGTYPTIAKLIAAGVLAGPDTKQTPTEPSKVEIVFNSATQGQPGQRPMSSQGLPKRPSSSAGRTMGWSEQQRPCSAAPALGSVKAAKGPLMTKETFKSKLPIKWAAAAGAQPVSTYASEFGSLAANASKLKDVFGECVCVCACVCVCVCVCLPARLLTFALQSSSMHVHADRAQDKSAHAACH